MSVIEAITRTCKTMSDGTLRLSIDISPIHAQEAFKMFGMPDVPMAIARLTLDSSKQSAQIETINHIGEATGMVNKPIGGKLARLAGMWCNDHKFFGWIKSTGWMFTESTFHDNAKKFIVETCGIDSRAELDNNPEAADNFHSLIRIPYSEYLKNHE